MPLTVLQLLPALEAGGVERGTLEVADALVKKGHRSLVVSGGGQLSDTLIAAGSEHIMLPVGKKTPFSIRLIPVLRSLILRENINIVHARSRLPAWLAWFAWKSLPTGNRTRFITTFHGPYAQNAYSKIMVRGEKVIAVSEYIQRYILQHYPDTDQKKIEVIPRGISATQYFPDYKPADQWLSDWRREHPQLAGKFVLCLPGRISRRKGHEDFIHIINQLVAANHNVHGLIIGSVNKSKLEYLGTLQNMIKKHQLAKHITFIDHRHDIREIMSVCNVIMSLSRLPEAFGRTVLESLGLGVPVIAYDIGGVAEIMGRVYPAGLVEHGNISDALEKITALFSSTPAISSIHEYQLETMLNRILGLYESMAPKT